MEFHDSIGLICSSFTATSPNKHSRSNGPWWKTFLKFPTQFKASEYGANVACNALNNAVIQYLPHNLTLLTPQANNVQLREATSFLNDKQRHIDVIDRTLFRSQFPGMHCSGWIDGSGIFPRPFQIRKLFAAKQYPILFTHHSLSYRSQIWDTFIPLFMSDTREWDVLICSSHAAKTQLTNIFEEISDSLMQEHNINLKFNGSMCVVPFGVDTDRFKPIDKVAARKKLGLPKKMFLFLFLGRVSAYDKADLIPILLAAKNLVSQHKQSSFRIVIAGGMVKDYRDLINALAHSLTIQDKILHIPTVSAEDLATLYGASDVFLSPSDNVQECFGLTVLEAMSCGIPQIVSDWSGYRDITQDAETGFLIPTFRREQNDDVELSTHLNLPDWVQHHFTLAQSTVVDVDRMTAAMLRLMTDNEARQRMARLSRNRAEALFSWKTVVDQYNQILLEKQTMLSSKKGEDCTMDLNKTYRYSSLFSSTRHFSTALIDNTTLFRSCGLVRENTLNDIPDLYLSHFKRFSDFCYPKDIEHILRSAQTPISFGLLVDEVKMIEGVNSAIAELQVVWLAKVGLLLICSSAN